MLPGVSNISDSFEIWRVCSRTRLRIKIHLSTEREVEVCVLSLKQKKKPNHQPVEVKPQIPFHKTVGKKEKFFCVTVSQASSAEGNSH